MLALKKTNLKLISNIFLLIAILFVTSKKASAWHDEGHYYTAAAATKALPIDVPLFFRDGYKTIAHGSIDPDIFKNRKVPQLTDIEGPEHYMDLEMLQGKELPKTRFDFYELCNDLNISPAKVGVVPYAVTEWAQRLTIAFAEYRQDPTNPHIQMKCLIYAGILAHYMGDINMPLHTSIHHNGYINEDGSVTGKGIHSKVDALPSKITYNQIFDKKLPKLAVRKNLFLFTTKQLKKSNAKVPQVYELADKLPATRDLKMTDKQVIAFTKECIRDAAWFTASIYYSAWKNSADVEIPSWVNRDVFDKNFNPDQLPDAK